MFRKFLSVLLVLALSLSTVCFAESFTVTDQAGREIAFDEPAETVVSCYYLSTATLLALGAKDQMVGIEMKADSRGLYKLAAPEFLSLPAVGSGKGVNVEEIAALNPDVVVLPKKLTEEAAPLEALGLKVVIVNPESQSLFEESIALLGQITGKADAASALLDRCAALSESVAKAVEGFEAPSVYMAAGSDFLTTYPVGLYQNDLISIAGGTNVAAELEGSSKASIDAEQLLAWNPEYIFIVADADYTVEDVLGNEQYAELTAVQENHVYAFPSDIEAWDYPTPSSVLGQVYLASVLHPDCIDTEAFLETAESFYLDVFGVEITVEDLGL